MNIILVVTGSISAYRSLDICRGLVKNGNTLRVICSKGAAEFLNPNAFHYLGAEKVYSWNDDFNLNQYEGETNVLHIDLVKWGDKVVIAPASANTLAKLANGFCDDLLSSLFLALGDKPCVIFPAMNSNMLAHPMVQENIEKIDSLANTFIHPTISGELACGDTGLGKLPSVEQVIDVSESYNKSVAGKTILITTGATISPLDPVRYITNPSTGKTGYELAKKYLSLGYKVILVYGYNAIDSIQNLKHLPNAILREAKTTKEMKQVVHEYFDDCDLYISTAAMSDIEFPMKNEKIKKSTMGNSIEYTQAPDVLASVLEKRTNQIIIGFAAETSAAPEIFLEKWTRKPVDLLVGNKVSNGITSDTTGFKTDSNEYYFIIDGKVVSQKVLSKSQLALSILSEAHFE